MKLRICTRKKRQGRGNSQAGGKQVGQERTGKWCGDKSICGAGVNSRKTCRLSKLEGEERENTS